MAYAVWYLRIRDKKYTTNTFDGILKIEKIMVTDEQKERGIDTDEVNLISANLINERNPVCYGADTHVTTDMQAHYENLIYNHVVTDVGKIPLNKLTQNDLQQFYGRLKVSGRKIRTEIYGKGLSDRMVRCCHAVCRKGLEKAVKDGLIRVNPAIGCKLPPKKRQKCRC
jgi:hypothetical protein